MNQGFFDDFVAMSETLRREKEVVDLFLELRKKSSDDAARWFIGRLRRR